MKVLILNGGSSSLKYHLFDMKSNITLFQGKISNIAISNGEHEYINQNSLSHKEPINIKDFHQALQITFDTIKSNCNLSINELNIIGHRIVHGGDRFQSPIVINDSVIQMIEKYNHLAPLHNPINIEIIRIARKELLGTTHIAIFDTTFHSTIPDYASIYAIPYQYYKEDKLRRYGFHGNSHEYVSLLASQYLERPLRRLKLITCHLGNGASICAIDRGQSIDTSMGLTPLEGLVMGTRSGDIDPAIITHLAQDKSLSISEIDRILNKESGLLGISGISSDMKVVEQAAEQGDHRALLAIKLFCYRVKKYIGAYMLALGWVNGIIFTGGIGENSRGVRMRILQDTEKFGIGIDENKNNRCHVDFDHPVQDISHRSSHAHILVIATNEELMMAKKCIEAISSQQALSNMNREAVRQIPIGISAHHVHLCRNDVDMLFGEGYQLTEAKPLSQPGQYACEEKVDLLGPRGTVKNVRILGPERKDSQVEISRTEEFILGIDAPVRESGDIEGTPPVTLIGPKGRVNLSQGVICAKRHIHMTPEDAKLFNVSNGDHVLVQVKGKGRELIFGDVVIRVHKDFNLEMHIDTDEANAGEITSHATGELLSIQKKQNNYLQI